MNKSSTVLVLVRNYTGSIDIDLVRQMALDKVNQPFVERGGSPSETAIAQWCYRGLTNVIDRGRSPKQELLDLIGLAVTWEALSKHFGDTDGEWSLLLFNSAVVHSLVISVIRPK